MIDVTFLILIFFMVTASFSLQRAIQTPNPDSQQASTNAVIDQPRDPLRLQVDRFGSFFLMADDWQQEIVGKQALIKQLTTARGNANDSLDLRIEVESDAQLQSLVDAIDAASLAGFAKYQLAEFESLMI